MIYIYAVAMMIFIMAGNADAQPANPCERDPKGVECTLCRHSGNCKPAETSKPRNADHPCARSMWLDRCPTRPSDIERAIGELQRATDACAVIVSESTKFRESRMSYDFSCERDLRDLQQHLNALDGFDLPVLNASDPAHEGKGFKHLEACVNDLIKPLYERIVPESVRNRPLAAPQSAAAGAAQGARPLQTPSPQPPMPPSPSASAPRAAQDDSREVTPVLFDNLNRLLGFKSIDLPMLDIRIREHANSIESLRNRLRVFKEDCGE